MRRRTAGLLRLVALLSLAIAARAQAAPGGLALELRPLGEVFFPIDSYTDQLSGAELPLYAPAGIGAGLALEARGGEGFAPFLRGYYLSVPLAGGGGALGVGEGDLGLGLRVRPWERASLRFDAMGGAAEILFPGGSGLAFAAGLRTGIGYRVTPAFRLSADAGYSSYFGTKASILNGFSAGLRFSFDLSALTAGSPRVVVDQAKLDAVFPSLYAYYDEAPFGTVRVTNGEDENIHDVRVSFNAAGYMAQPKLCSTLPAIARGASVTVPIRALFDDRVLEITQGFEAKGEIIVEYEYVGSTRTLRWPVDFRMHHRNAITWSDDRRAASFVSATNPAALWFSRFAAGVVRDRLRGVVNRPLQYAVGMFEAERLYGLNYVVVPANDYSVKHGLKDFIDSVQFPHQTLQNRGGDCSDLAILFASLMESVGVEAAFITIPGHIFAAFDSGLSSEEAPASFYDPKLLIYKDGRAWIPVEITMVQDGFIKAWRVGAKEWYDNEASGSAAFYALADCWRVYPPASVPGIDPRFVLPGEADLAKAYDLSLDRFVAREIETEVDRQRIVNAALAPAAAANEMGVLFARYGMLKQAWANFSEGAKAGSAQAWTNLANVAFLQRDYKLALGYYDYVAKLDARDPGAVLGRARCEYELGDFAASDADFAKVRSLDPRLAARFGYLASIYGGQGRAFSLADRAGSVEWSSTPRPAPALIAALGPGAGAAAAPPTPSAAARAKAAREAEAPAPPAPPDRALAAVAESGQPPLAAQPSAPPSPAPSLAGLGPKTAPVEPAQAPKSPEPAGPPAPGPAAADSPVESAQGASETPSPPTPDAGTAAIPSSGAESEYPSSPAPASIAEGPAAGSSVEPGATAPPAIVPPDAILGGSTETSAEAKSSEPGPTAERVPAPSPAPPSEPAPETAVVAAAAARPSSAPILGPEPPAAAAGIPGFVAPKIAEELPTDLDIAEKEAEQRRVAALSGTTPAPAPAPTPAAVAVAEPEALPNTPAPNPAAVVVAEAEAQPSATPPALASEPAAPQPEPPARMATEEESPMAAREAPSPSVEAPNVAVPEPPVASTQEAPPPLEAPRPSAPEPVQEVPLPQEAPKIPEVQPALAMSPPLEAPRASAEAPQTQSGQASQSGIDAAPSAGPGAVSLPGPVASEPAVVEAPPSPSAAAEPTLPGSTETPGAGSLASQSPTSPPESAESTSPAPAVALALPSQSIPPPALPSREAPAPLAMTGGEGPEAESSPRAESPSDQQSLETGAEEGPIAQGFGGSRVLLGEWSVTDTAARQLDKEAFFAKLASPLVQESLPYRYSFVAASEARGRGWVGLGATVFVPSSGLVKGYGSGNALLVWLTRDPVHFAKDITRLQVYRSVNEWKMVLVAEVPVSESIYDGNRFEIALDPGAGTVSISLNGKNYLTASGVDGLEAGSYVVFRSLDQASFEDFTARRDGTGANR